LQIEQDILNPVDEQIAALLLLQSAVRARYANQFSKAIDYAAQSKAVWEGLGEMAGAATALVALGDVAYVQGNWSEAEESYDQARGIMESLDIHPGTNNARRYAQVLWAYSRVLTHKRQYQKALGLIEKAQQAAAGDSFGLAICKQLAGYVYLELGRFSRARSSFNEAVVCSRRAGHFHSEAQSLVALASVALSEDCLDEVMKYLEEAQEVAQQEGFQDILEQIDDIRSDCRQMVKV
jgi:tetratricopeptide (TPR) repeat protein